MAQIIMIPKEKFDEIYSQVPRLCVEVLILTDEGYILSKRLIEPCSGMWHIPGGTVKFGEKLTETARRIGMEELGVRINPISVIGILNYTNIYGKGKDGKEKGHSVGIAFLCTLDKNNKNNKNNNKFRGSYQAEEIKAFTIDDIPENTIPEHERFLSNVGSYIGNRIYLLEDLIGE